MISVFFSYWSFVNAPIIKCLSITFARWWEQNVDSFFEFGMEEIENNSELVAIMNNTPRP